MFDNSIRTMNRFLNLAIAIILLLYGTGYSQSNSVPDEGVSYTAFADDHCWANQKHDDQKFLHSEEIVPSVERSHIFVAIQHIHSAFHSPVSGHIRGPPSSIVPA